MNFITNICIGNFIDIDLNKEDYYKIFIVNFEISRYKISYKKYLENINLDDEFIRKSPLMNKNLCHLMMVYGDEGYKKYFEKYKEVCNEIYSCYNSTKSR